MKIVHRFAYNFGKNNISLCNKLVNDLCNYGIECDIELSPLVVFDMEEGCCYWDEVIQRVKDIGFCVNFIKTTFSKKEMSSKDFFALDSSWHHGYPMPDDDFGYKNITYDPESCCKTCYIGKIQQAPFRMRIEPQWGTRHAMQLNWVFDELFIRREVWQTHFRPLGIDCIPVIHHKKRMELESVVQLKIDEISPVPLKLDGFNLEICPDCGRQRYECENLSRGFFPEFNRNMDCDIVKTKEWFGSGHSSSRRIIVSKKIYQIIQENKLKGFRFTPMGSREGIKDIKI